MALDRRLLSSPACLRADRPDMNCRQDRAPLAVWLAVGVLTAGLGLLTAHNWLHLAYPSFLPGAWWDWLYNALEIGAVALCGARAVARRRDRATWSALTIGLGLFAVGDMYDSVVWERGRRLGGTSPMRRTPVRRARRRRVRARDRGRASDDARTIAA